MNDEDGGHYMAEFLKRLRALGKTGLSTRSLSHLCAAWCAVMLLPLFLISFCAHPVHDDYPHTIAVAEAWMRTGSLWSAATAALDRALYMYNTWQGTFTAMFLSAFQPMVFSPNLYFLTPVIILGGLCLSAAYFSKALICRVFKANASVCVVFFSVLMTLLLQFLPSAREVIYWHSGTPYTLSVILLFLMLGLLMKLHQTSFSPSAAARIALLISCGVLFGGCTYPLALGGTLGFFFIALVAFHKRSPARWACLGALAGCALGLALVVIAPGNIIRQARVGQPMEPLKAIIQSLAECLEMSGRWFSPQLAAAVLLLLPLLTPVLRESGFQFRRPILVLTASFGVLSAAFVPPIFATGADGYRVERVLSSLYMLYILLMLLNLIYLTGFFIRRSCSLSSFTEILERKGITLGILTLSAALLTWGLFSSAIMATPSISAARSLLTGEAARYRQEMTQREGLIASGENRAQMESAIHPLTTEPVVLPRDMLIYQREGNLPAMMRRYFRMQQLGKEYGPGNIPQSRWEDLDAWKEN